LASCRRNTAVKADAATGHSHRGRRRLVMVGVSKVPGRGSAESIGDVVGVVARRPVGLSRPANSGTCLPCPNHGGTRYMSRPRSTLRMPRRPQVVVAACMPKSRVLEGPSRMFLRLTVRGMRACNSRRLPCWRTSRRLLASAVAVAACRPAALAPLVRSCTSLQAIAHERRPCKSRLLSRWRTH